MEHSQGQLESSSSSSSSSEIAHSSGYKTPSCTSNTTKTNDNNGDEVDTDMMVTPANSSSSDINVAVEAHHGGPRRRRRRGSKLMKLLTAINETRKNSKISGKKKIHPMSSPLGLSDRMKEQTHKLKRQFNKARNSPVGMIIEIPPQPEMTNTNCSPSTPNQQQNHCDDGNADGYLSATVTVATSPASLEEVAEVHAAPTANVAAVVTAHDAHRDNFVTTIPIQRAIPMVHKTSSSISSLLVVQADVVSITENDGYESDSNSTIDSSELENSGFMGNYNDYFNNTMQHAHDDFATMDSEIIATNPNAATCSGANVNEPSTTTSTTNATTIATLEEDKTPNKYHSQHHGNKKTNKKNGKDKNSKNRLHGDSCCCYDCHQEELLRIDSSAGEAAQPYVPYSLTSTIPTATGGSNY